MRIGILEPEDFSPTAESGLRAIGTVVRYDPSTSIGGFVEELDVLFVRLGRMIDANFLDLAPRLSWLCSATTGLTHIDLGALAERRIGLVSLRGERKFLRGIEATSTHAIGLMISLVRKYQKLHQSESFTHLDRISFIGRDLDRLAVGIIGYGRIGKKVSNICAAFNQSVYYFDPKIKSYRSRASKITSIENLLALSDIIILCASYTPGDAPILQRQHLLSMKGKYFINIARGELIDEDTLYDLVRSQWFEGVALDVLDSEQSKLSDNWRKWSMLGRNLNVIVTPHIGGMTRDSLWKCEEFIVDKLICGIMSKRPDPPISQ